MLSTKASACPHCCPVSTLPTETASFSLFAFIKWLGIILLYSIYALQFGFGGYFNPMKVLINAIFRVPEPYKESTVKDFLEKERGSHSYMLPDGPPPRSPGDTKKGPYDYRRPIFDP